MKRFILPILFLLMSIEIYSQSYSIDILLQKLDSLITIKDEFVKTKETRIQELREKQTSSLKKDEKIWLNKMFYDEFYVYRADSAMNYVEDNILLSKELGNKELEQEWLLNKVFLLSATGLLRESEQAIEEVQVDCLTDELKFEYYDRIIYLYSHLGQYIGSRPKIVNSYYEKEAEFKRKALKYLKENNQYYYSFMGSLHVNYPRDETGNNIKKELIKVVESSALSTRIDAINAYVLARMFYYENDEKNYMRYLIYSAMADVKICNHDIASLEELANILYLHGDIDRGYTYINYCLNCALLYPNRVRVVNISSVMDKLHKAYQERNIIQESRLRTFLYTISFLSIILLTALFLIYIQFRKLSKSRELLNKNNQLLNQHVEELSHAKEMLDKVNKELNDINSRLKDTNNKLLESNYVKEEYIGYVFSICSNYISKLEEYRKNISRKLKAGQVDEVKTLTSSTTVVQSELKEFYNSFDAIFLHVYPDFVDDFNSLLRPEEKVILKDGELLNTELRIYALVRLGINDSVKIAEFLHCSPQTVYNNRLKTRNKAIIPKEEFADTVRSLGKMQK